MITLRPVTSNNVWEIYDLKADESLVDSNPMSLVEAYFYYQDTGVHPMIYGIYHEDVPVGFIMANYSINDENFKNDGQPCYYLWRLMIDEKYQKKGYGKAAMDRFIEEIKTFPRGKANAIFTSTVPISTVTPKFYASLGFVETGEMSGDETVVRLAL